MKRTLLELAYLYRRMSSKLPETCGIILHYFRFQCSSCRFAKQTCHLISCQRLILWVRKVASKRHQFRVVRFSYKTLQGHISFLLDTFFFRCSDLNHNCFIFLLSLKKTSWNKAPRRFTRT